MPPPGLAEYLARQRAAQAKATAATRNGVKGKLTPPIKWHGGKSYLARKIVALMPARAKNGNKPADDDPGWVTYCEPFFGGGAVWLALDPEDISEVVNDLDRNLSNFWRVLQGVETFERFFRILQATPFSEVEWNEAADRLNAEDPVERAVALYVRVRQSLAGRMDAFTGITRNRTRRKMNAECSAWLSAIDGLAAIHGRLSRVLIRDRPALEIIDKEDTPRTLFYCDPPYYPLTRAAPDVYSKEMTCADHQELLDALGGIEGRFLLSGYDNTTYDLAAKQYGWHRVDFDLPNNAAAGRDKRRMVESVWCNYDPQQG
jgi:DNA adenine methylase